MESPMSQLSGDNFIVYNENILKLPKNIQDAKPMARILVLDIGAT